MFNKDDFLRIDDVVKRYGISKSTVHRWRAQKILPEPIRVWPRYVGWAKETLYKVFLGEK